MICTKCGQKLQETSGYHRTRRGAHHFVCPTAEPDFGVEPYSPEDAIGGACGILDVIKSEWGEEWSEHDQRVRAGLSRILSGHLLDGNIPDRPDHQAQLAAKDAVIAGLVEALTRAERKLRAYVGVCKGDKELTDTVLPMASSALALAEPKEGQ